MAKKKLSVTTMVLITNKQVGGGVG